MKITYIGMIIEKQNQAESSALSEAQKKGRDGIGNSARFGWIGSTLERKEVFVKNHFHFDEWV